MANSSDDEKQTKRYGKVPKICAADEFVFWEASFDTYLGDECVEAIKSAKPLEDEAILHQHRNSPARLEIYKQKVKRALSKWQKHQCKVFFNIISRRYIWKSTKIIRTA